MPKYICLIGCCLVLMCFGLPRAFSQAFIVPYDNNYYSAFEHLVTDRSTRIHTSMKPFFVQDSIRLKIDSLYFGDRKRHSTWVGRKLFDEHLVEFRKPDFSVNIDFLPNSLIGRDLKGDRTIWTDTRGVQVQADIGKKVYINTYFFETQSRFPDYIERRIRSNQVVPGQGRPSNYVVDIDVDNKSFDYPVSGGYISYTPNKFLNVVFGQDKNFIGDGYRSMLFSDASFSYPFLKLNITLDNVRYMTMWGQFQDPSSPQFSYDQGLRRKWGVFHYLDWNISRKFSAGFFDSVIWADADENGKRGFDVAYLNPFAFLRPVEYSIGSPDNALLGFNLKYNVTSKVTTYGQLALDEFRFQELFAGDGWWANKYGVQIGLKAQDLFSVSNLHLTTEFNTARPYTYSSRTSLQNYGHYNEPLAHPYGANFKEALGILHYRYKSLQFRGQLTYARYGLDPAGDNFGKDVLKPYTTRESDYNNRTGQGINTKLYYGDFRAAWLMNPRINMRLEAGVTLRKETNILGAQEAAVFSIGLKAAFRNLYFDF